MSTAVSVQAISADLMERDQWVLWGFRTFKGKKNTKIPFQADGNRASSTEPKTWCSYADAVNTLEADTDGRFDGIGYVFSGQDEYCGIDLDNCIDENGGFKPWACAIVERFADTYMELSPSGRGVKLWVKAKLQGSGKHAVVGDGAVEIYDRSRYFTVTGRRVTGAPLQIEEHQAAVDWLCSTYIVKTTRSIGPQGKILKGVQHHTLVSIAGAIRARGGSEKAIFELLKVMNAEQCEESGSEEDIRDIAKTAGKWEPGSFSGDRRTERQAMPTRSPYPTPLGEAAYHGIVGEFVRLVEPHTEADSNFLLIQFLAYAGNYMGRRTYIQVWRRPAFRQPFCVRCGFYV